VLVGQKATSDILDPETHKLILKKHRRITEGSYKRLELAKINTIPIEMEDSLEVPRRGCGRFRTGEVVAETNRR